MTCRNLRCGREFSDRQQKCPFCKEDIYITTIDLILSGIINKDRFFEQVNEAGRYSEKLQVDIEFETEFFKHPDNPFYKLTKLIKRAQAEQVKSYLKSLARLEEGFYIKGIKEALKAGHFHSAVLTGVEHYGALWWLTFQTSGEPSWHDSQPEFQQQEGNRLTLYDLCNSFITGRFAPFFNNCRNVYNAFKLYIGFVDSGLYGGGNLMGGQNIKEDQCVNYCLSKAYMDSQIRMSQSLKVLHQRFVGFANTLHFSYIKHSTIFEAASTAFQNIYVTLSPPYSLDYRNPNYNYPCPNLSIVEPAPAGPPPDAPTTPS